MKLLNLKVHDHKYITGRGLILIISLSANNYQAQLVGLPIHVGDTIEYEGTLYEIKGIELQRQMEFVGDNIGLVVKKCDDNSSKQIQT